MAEYAYGRHATCMMRDSMAHAHFATSTKQCNEQAVAPHGRVRIGRTEVVKP